MTHVIDRKFKSLGNMKQPSNTEELAQTNNRRRKNKQQTDMKRVPHGLSSDERGKLGTRETACRPELGRYPREEGSPVTLLFAMKNPQQGSLRAVD